MADTDNIYINPAPEPRCQSKPAGSVQPDVTKDTARNPTDDLKEEEKQDTIEADAQIAQMQPAVVTDTTATTATTEAIATTQYAANSLNEAKQHYQQTKHRESGKFEGGQKKKVRQKSAAQQYIDNVTQQLMPQIEQTGKQLLSASDDAVASLSASTGIAFAPINIPFQRRRQTFAVLLWSSMILIAAILNFCAFRYWTGWKFYLYLLWLTYKALYQTFHKDGGLPIPFVRHAVVWQWFRDYFPIRLHKRCELDASGNTSYLFGYHPHGIIGMGAVGTFAMLASGFNRLFPGVDVRLLTLKTNFYIPFFDLVLTFMGMCDASRDSCNAILGDTEEPKSLCLVLGGAKESLEANPGVVKLYLKSRKGFVKVALENGASLVPVFGFGENELYEQVENPEGSWIRNVQNQLQLRLGFALPVFSGRGVFQYNYGLLPHRRPIDVVFGKPIQCPKMTKATITPEIIDKYHVIYCQELKTLFDEEKANYYDKKQPLPEMLFI